VELTGDDWSLDDRELSYPMCATHDSAALRHGGQDVRPSLGRSGRGGVSFILPPGARIGCCMCADMFAIPLVCVSRCALCMLHAVGGHDIILPRHIVARYPVLDR
jgi:hypothetical protein